MICWHCDHELVFKNETANFEKFYHCESCDRWYEMRKDKVRTNAAVPVRFFELETRPHFPVSEMKATAAVAAA